jgi:hypothetical protein
MAITRITGGMLRAARSLTGLSQQELADRASISSPSRPQGSAGPHWRGGFELPFALDFWNVSWKLKGRVIPVPRRY